MQVCGRAGYIYKVMDKFARVELGEINDAVCGRGSNDASGAVVDLQLFFMNR